MHLIHSTVGREVYTPKGTVLVCLDMVSKKTMIDEYTRDEFQDCINEINERYNEIKTNIKTTNDTISEDIKYVDGMLTQLQQYTEYKLDDYLIVVSDLCRSLYYFQKDTDLIYSIPLLQLLISFCRGFIVVVILAFE